MHAYYKRDNKIMRYIDHGKIDPDGMCSRILQEIGQNIERRGTNGQKRIELKSPKCGLAKIELGLAKYGLTKIK